MKKLTALVLTLVFILMLAGCREPAIKDEIPDSGAALGATTDAATIESSDTGASLDGVLDGGADIGVDAVP